MNDDIPPEIVDKMMVKCARRCCICRRFRPTKLQVHHIVERNQGGTDDEDNLIVVCFTCHSDVHTKVPFARRFSNEELKGHRDALIKMIEEGKLPLNDTDDTDEVIARIVRDLHTSSSTELNLMSEAVELLLSAVNTEGSRQGVFIAYRTNMGLTIGAGDRKDFIKRGDRRSEAKYKHALDQLVTCGLAERLSKDALEVTYEGYLAADEIMARRVVSPST
jgi:hypothetical protein